MIDETEWPANAVGRAWHERAEAVFPEAISNVQGHKRGQERAVGDALLFQPNLHAKPVALQVFEQAPLGRREPRKLSREWPFLAHPERLMVQQYRLIHEQGLDGREIGSQSREHGEPVFTGAVGHIHDVALLTYATARVPNDALAAPLRARGLDVRLVGDCYAPRWLPNAASQGARAGLDL